MSATVLGFIRGVGYSALGGALFGISNFLLAQPYLAGGIALVITGYIASLEHKYNIPTPSSSSAS